MSMLSNSAFGYFVSISRHWYFKASTQGKALFALTGVHRDVSKLIISTWSFELEKRPVLKSKTLKT